MQQRILYGAIMIAGVGAILVADYLWGIDAVVFAALAFLACVGYAELASMLEKIGIRVPRVRGIVLCVVVLLAMFLLPVQPNLGAALLAGALLAACFLFLGTARLENGRPDLAGAAFGILGMVYIGASLGSFLVLRGLPADRRTGVVLFATVIAITKISDITAYFTGSFVGKHKMTPTISPNKTWEGFAGELAGGAIVSLVILGLCFHVMPAWLAAGYGVAISVAACGGDLVESKVKRICGVKDSGSYLGAFGGVLDLVDSLLLAGPAACLIALVS